MAGPVYHGIDPKNQFVPPPKKVDGPLVIAGPVYKGVENTHRCHTLPDKAEVVPQVSAPIYPTNYQQLLSTRPLKGHRYWMLVVLFIRV